ncbi:unnamed protein product [marine sediment metagenome]|uniref:Uncharacterized protein n=1 Tax=marine sediment metagenome TaxID=412755 RepID=X1GIM6_9ZZZZ
MVSSRTILKGMASTAAIAAASITGGPIVGAQVAAFLASPPGQALLDEAIDRSASSQGVMIDDLARGGLVSYPTLGLTGEAGPEMVIPIKKKRKASAAQKRYGLLRLCLKMKEIRYLYEMLRTIAHEPEYQHQQLLEVAKHQD